MFNFTFITHIFLFKLVFKVKLDVIVQLNVPLSHIQKKMLS